MTLGILNDLIRGFCVGVAASITVGPVAVLCIQRTLSKSRRSGIVSGIGVACADTFMAMAALFFYSMLQTQIEQYNTLLRVIGGIFVVIVGVYIFTQNPVPQIRRNRAGKSLPVAGLRLDLRADDRQLHHGHPPTSWPSSPSSRFQAARWPERASAASCARSSSSPGSSPELRPGGRCWPRSSASSAGASVRATC